MHTYPKITIITPSFNQGNFLERTILSVVNQGYPNLEYMIIDGGSTDNSIDIIRKYENRVSYWVSEKDAGMYFALAKGFAQATGEIMGWLNSDDILHNGSLFSLHEIFSHQEINWVQGYPNVIDESDRILYTRRPRWCKYDFYNREYNSDNVFIQQESTFWRRSLWEKAGAYINTQLRYAGDFELWIRFFQCEEIYITNALLGGFRRRKTGQISSNHYDEYIRECDAVVSESISKSDNTLHREMKKIIELLDVKKKSPRLAKLLKVDQSLKSVKGYPKVVTYNFDQSKFQLQDGHTLDFDNYSNL
jgi:glycosyltransferase involved in cell wall biosynthesis